ncbi:16S rRNA (cytosine(1402)-N(4))-methyltransferase RsmH [Phaeodactylibacter luteus]|uniref:Ribosomal RNA small subunit methyltransferase H n=1 Tax=Phaeodactylibacter luteus TaxID=1564516 RepID=A0A5C6RHN1_9BACT|nr:16S rRNA (cytosine(1402)-N(4))-methyltransferase RsmH [Phaeodactylibacter luteus]TXB61534.1 16S rRNA (cytosine(1402)-N(4))-methyltransferase RsmH [Phaeodactylibacter luteus]
MTYHLPVLAQPCVDGLVVNADGVYVDVTFGGGGHSRLILDHLSPKGQLLGFDQDEDAQANVPDDSRFTFVQHNFRFLKRFLKLHGHKEVDGILADLGVSSHQLDVPERGFSFRFDAPLDMRMNQQQEETAAGLLRRLSAEELQDILGRYGEVRNARTLAARLVDEQASGRRIDTVGDLLAVAEPLIRGNRARYLAQVFQALRIAVNDEMGALEDFLQQCAEVLKPGGRLVVLSYHSLEDRAVKHFLKTGNVSGEQEKDFYGNISRPFKLITRKAVLPTEKEIRENSRARSAKLRIGEKR